MRSFLILLILPCASLAAQDSAEFTRLRHLQTVTGEHLTAACNVNFSPCGKHLYVAAWQAATIAMYEPEAQTGRLTHRQSITDTALLNGATTIRVSPDARYAVAAAFRARTVILFERDPFSGKLTVLDTIRGADRNDLGLTWPIDAEFSPDGRFVYVCDPKQSGAGNDQSQQGSILVFEVTRLGKLELVEINRGENNDFFGCRGIEFHPDGRTGYAACTNSSQIVVVDRDPDTGKLDVTQVIKDGRDASAIEGVIGIVCSADGRFVYAGSGRFSGDSAVVAFEIGEDGKLALVQEIVEGQDGLSGFVGGNELTLSPDGSMLYATATRSGSLATFRRDPESGRLTHLETLHDARFIGQLSGAADVAVSRDGRFVYVVAETGRSIDVLAAESTANPEPPTTGNRPTSNP